MASVSPSAADITKAWGYIADSWRLRLLLEPVKMKFGWTDQWYLACGGYANSESDKDIEWGGCGAPILLVHDGSFPQLINIGQIKRLTIAHLREKHEGLEAAVRKNARDYALNRVTKK